MDQTRQLGSMVIRSVPGAWINQTRQLGNTILMLVPHTNSSLIQIAGARQLGNTLVQSTWMEQTRQLGNAMVMLVQTEPGPIHMNQINRLGNELVQSANDLVERYQGVDMASLAQVIRTRVMVQLDRYLDLLDGFQSTVAWLLERCDHYPFISFLLAYAFFLAFISMSPHFILSPRIPLGATRKKDKNVDEMGGGFRHGSTVTAHTELIQRAFFPALETHVSVSDLLFSSRLFIPLLWTWTARHPVPYLTLPTITPAISPRLRPALLRSTLFINTNYRRESAPEAEAEAEPDPELEPEVVAEAEAGSELEPESEPEVVAEAEAGSETEPEPIRQEDTNNPVVFRTPAAVGNSNTLWSSPLRVPDQTRLSLPISGDKSSNVVFNSSPSQKGNGKKKRRGGISRSSIDKASKTSSSHSSTGSFSNIFDMFRKRRSAPAVMDKYSSSSAANIGKKKRSRLSSWLDVLPAVSKKQKRKSSQLSSEISSTSQSDTTYSGGASEVHDEFERQLYRETSACTTCNITVSQNMLDADFVSDAYDPSRIPAYIPLTTAPKHEDESIDPCHVPGRSPSKHEDGGRGQSVSVQQVFLAAEHPLSVYAFHRHVHEHRQYRRSFLTLCRSEDEVKRWQGWAGRMERGKDEVESVNRRNVKAIEEKDDRNAILETPPPDGYMDTGLLIELGDENENENENKNIDKQAWFARSTACELKNQVRLWWTQANFREQRLRESRAVWEQLKKQREKERQQLLWERRKEMIRYACSKERVKKRIEAMRAKRAEWKKREPERRVKRARERNAAKREERKKMTWKTRPPSVHSIPPDERWMV